MNIDNVKVGDLLWWTAERYFKSWDVPCVVIKIDRDVSNGYLTVRTFDDDKETKLNVNGEAISDEFRHTSIQEVIRFFNNEIANTKKTIIDFENQIEDANLKIEDFTKRKNLMVNRYGK